MSVNLKAQCESLKLSPIVRPVLVLQLRLMLSILRDFDTGMFEGIIIDFVDLRCSVEGRGSLMFRDLPDSSHKLWSEYFNYI